MQRLPCRTLAALAVSAVFAVSATAAQAGDALPEPCFEFAAMAEPAAPATATAAAPDAAGSGGLSDAELARLAEQEAKTEVILTTGALGPSRRGAVLDYLAAPSGGELTAAFRMITTEDPALGGPQLRLSDLALFELSGRWALAPRLELSGQIALLAKQPARTSEKPWQSAALAVRTPFGDHGAIAVGGSGGHLIGHAGMWLAGSSGLQWRAPVGNYVHFDLAGGLDAIRVSAPGAMSASLAEANASFQCLFSLMDTWALWIGGAYAVPVASGGMDPTTGLAIDPRARLDVRIGTAMVVAPDWDVFAEYAVVDRGDLSAPQTRLPILDGGFDQRQLLLGVTRHFEGAPPPGRRSHRGD